MADISKEKCIELAQLFELKLHHWRLLTGVTSSKDDSFTYKKEGIFPVQHTDDELSKLTAAEQFEIGEFCASEPLLFPCLPSELLHFIDNLILGDFSVPDDFREAVEQSMRGPDVCGIDSLIDWYNDTLKASIWFGLQSVAPRDAAMLLCQFNPHDVLHDPLEVFNPETGPGDYKLLLCVFDDVAKADSQPRTLLQWLAIAKDKRLKYHSWIDEYVNVAMPEQIDGVAAVDQEAEPDAPESGEVIDTTGMVAWQAAILDNWQAVTAKRGNTITARQVMAWCKNSGPRDVFGCEQTNRRESILWMDRTSGDIHTLTLARIGTVLSEWRKEGKVPPRK